MCHATERERRCGEREIGCAWHEELTSCGRQHLPNHHKRKPDKQRVRSGRKGGQLNDRSFIYKNRWRVPTVVLENP